MAKRKVKVIKKVRSHIRRAHIRKLKGGKTVPVKKARVKSFEKGYYVNEGNVFVTRYIGNKRKLVGIIKKQVPNDAQRFMDAFAGSGVVGYVLSMDGKQVLANDILRMSYHLNRAILQNKRVKLSEEDVEMLLRPTKAEKAQKLWKNKYLTPGILEVIDDIRANAEKLSGYKKDIALAALASAMVRTQPFGHFEVTKKAEVYKHERARRDMNKERFIQLFKEEVERINSLVGTPGKGKVWRMDVVRALERAKKSFKPDVVYFDPPYITEYNAINYERKLSPVELVLSNFRDPKFLAWEEERVNKFQNLNRKNINEFFSSFINASKGIPTVIVSYVEHGYPRKEEIKEMLNEAGYRVRVIEIPHHYSLGATAENKEATELLFVAKLKKKRVGNSRKKKVGVSRKKKLKS